MEKSNCQKRICKWYRSTKIVKGKEVHYCMAYPFGIPDEIAFGDNLHLTPYTGYNRGNFVYQRGTDIKRVGPYPEHRMHDWKMFGRDTLCSTLRDIYLKTDDEDIKLWSRLAVTMAKYQYEWLAHYKELLVANGIDPEIDMSPDMGVRETWQYTKPKRKG